MKLFFQYLGLIAALLPPSLAIGQGEDPELQPVETTAVLVTANSAGQIKLGMAVSEARELMKSATFERSTEDGGLALITVSQDGETILRLSTGEEVANSAIDGKAIVESIEVLSPDYRTEEGAHPGMSLEDAEKIHGKAVELVTSELEAREYVTFSRQPSGLLFRLSNKNGTAGIYKAGEMVTTTYRPGSEIAAIEIIGADIMADGRIGGLALDAPESEVVAIGEKENLGELSRGKDEISEAFGEAVQTWTFTGAGFSANMVSGESGAPKTVLSIAIVAPSTLKTEHGIGIGSTRDEVIRAYADYKTEEEEAEKIEADGDKRLVGSIYGGMVFTFSEGKVTRIFLGAAAE